MSRGKLRNFIKRLTRRVNVRVLHSSRRRGWPDKSREPRGAGRYHPKTGRFSGRVERILVLGFWQPFKLWVRPVPVIRNDVSKNQGEPAAVIEGDYTIGLLHSDGAVQVFAIEKENPSQQSQQGGRLGVVIDLIAQGCLGSHIVSRLHGFRDRGALRRRPVETGRAEKRRNRYAACEGFLSDNHYGKSAALRV